MVFPFHRSASGPFRDFYSVGDLSLVFRPCLELCESLWTLAMALRVLDLHSSFPSFGVSFSCFGVAPQEERNGFLTARSKPRVRRCSLS